MIDEAFEPDGPSRNVLGVQVLWAAITLVLWATTCSLFVLSISPIGFVPTWWALVALVAFATWIAATTKHHAVMEFARRRLAELLMAGSISLATATSMFATTLVSILVWVLIAILVVLAIVAGCISSNRSWLRLAGLLGGWLIVVMLLFSPVLQQPASSIGLRIRVAMVDQTYRSAADDLMRAFDPLVTKHRYYAIADGDPASGRVLADETGVPQVVVWTWWAGLAITHPYGLVYDPNGQLRTDGGFIATGPAGGNVDQCENVTGDWWRCVQYA